MNAALFVMLTLPSAVHFSKASAAERKLALSNQLLPLSTGSWTALQAPLAQFPSEIDKLYPVRAKQVQKKQKQPAYFHALLHLQFNCDKPLLASELTDMINQRTRVTIVAGFLGAGKTSVMRELIRSSAAKKTAVLVNEIGALGIDGDLLSNDESRLDVQELIGGCICCTAMIVFKHKLVQMLRRRPERLLIEPTGLAAVGTLVDVFSEPGIAPAVSLDPTLVVIDPRHWAQDHIRQHELYQEQCARADVMLVSHSDCCEPELLERFEESHSQIPLIRALHGVLQRPLPASIAQPSTARPEQSERTGSSVSGFFSNTVQWSTDKYIDLEQVSQLLAQQPPPHTVLRIKGLLRTAVGWREVQWDNSELAQVASKSKAPSRLVMIAHEQESARQWWQRIMPQLEALGQPQQASLA